MQVLYRSAGFVAALALVALVGCGPGGPDIATVEGTVTMDGKPLANAAVVFIPEAGGRPAGSRTDAEGKYNLNFSGGRKGTIPGVNKVRISTKSDPSEDADGNPVPAAPETIPMEYNQETTLTFTVVDGEKNVADFPLKSGGKIAADVSGY